jgi:hypothetical protein
MKKIKLGLLIIFCLLSVSKAYCLDDSGRPPLLQVPKVQVDTAANSTNKPNFAILVCSEERNKIQALWIAEVFFSNYFRPYLNNPELRESLSSVLLEIERDLISAEQDLKECLESSLSNYVR